MATLTHWNTVEVFDYGRADDGTFYYVMEYLPGRNLETLVARHGPLPPGRVVHFLAQVCNASCARRTASAFCTGTSSRAMSSPVNAAAWSTW